MAVPRHDHPEHGRPAPAGAVELHGAHFFAVSSGANDFVRTNRPSPALRLVPMRPPPIKAIRQRRRIDGNDHLDLWTCQCVSTSKN